MFFSNLLILGGGLLMATTGVDARAIGKLSFLPHLPFTTTATTATPLSPPQPQTPQQTCAFSPHLPLRTTQSSFSIPESAWPLLQTLLTTHIIPQAAPASPPSSTPPSTPSSPGTQPEEQQQQKLITKNSVLTLPLRDFTTDASLENLILGLVFSTGEQEDASYKELRSLPEISRRAQEEEERSRSWACVEEAIRKVEEERVMEGVLGLDGRGGTVGFLVYRVD
ncbi:hypothetical protein BKA65DRAFT_210213 [Rhexocercosporidium sp. MPI-PUGE-AT-0058]|nr:hypothetical protein BKA65DRAFT_210213 [Rhexocercosporidium sp. MPI-PUGE-AT-0058]